MKNFHFFILSFFICSLSFSQGWSDFEDGTLNSWTNVDASTTSLTNELRDVPLPFNGHFFQKICDGSNSPIGEMAIINLSEYWVGTYPTGFFDAFAELDFFVKNENDFDLHIRIGYTGGSDNTKIIYTNSVVIPAFSDWTYVRLPIYFEAFTIIEGSNTIEEIFEDSHEARIIHNEIVSYDGAQINGVLMIDDLSSFYLLSSFDHQNLNDVKLYPNPVLDVVTLKLPLQSKGSIEFYNVLGERVLTEEFSSISTQIDLSNLNTGIYILSIKTENAFITKKIVKL